MLATIKSILAAAKRDNAKSDEVAETLAAARQELAAAESAIEKIEGLYGEKLLESSDAELRKLADERASAEIRRDRAEALIDLLVGKLEAAQTAEAETARRERYEAARKAQQAAAKALPKEYAKAARAMLDVLRQVAEAEALIRTANEDLPAGAAQIETVETIVRCLPTRQKEIVRETVEERWVSRGTTYHPYSPNWLPDDLIKKIEKTGERTGVIKRENGGPVAHVELRKFRRVEFLEEEGSWRQPSLAGSIRLPGLFYGSGAVWQDFDNDSPAAIIARIEEAERTLAAPRPADPRGHRTTDVRWFEVPTPVPAPIDDEAA